jgi:hypothetical protein
MTPNLVRDRLDSPAPLSRLTAMPMNAQGLFFATAIVLLASSAQAQSDASSAATSAPVSPPPAPASAPLPPPAAPPEPHYPLAAAPETIPAAPPESDRGDRGESCRARADCKAGLACTNQVCVAAGASPRPVEPPPSARPFTIDLDVLAYNASGPSTVVLGSSQTVASFAVNQSYDSAVLGIRYVRSDFRFEIELPFASFSGSETTALGNIAFGFYYRHDYGALKLEVGGIVALPTAPVDSTLVADSPGVSALVTPGPSQLLASRGGDRAWLWIPHYFVPLAPSARLASGEGRVLSELTELTLAPMIATDAGVSNVLVPVVQLAEEVAAHVSVFRGGVRTEVVGAFANTGSAGYLSVMPFVGIGGAYGFLDLGALFDLVNAPPPSSGDASPNWGLRVRGGLHF